jgi:hypothetical protein
MMRLSSSGDVSRLRLSPTLNSAKQNVSWKEPKRMSDTCVRTETRTHTITTNARGNDNHSSARTATRCTECLTFIVGNRATHTPDGDRAHTLTVTSD